MSEAAARGGFGSAPVITRDALRRSPGVRRDEGDQRAFAAIYRRYHQSLYRYCLAIVGNSQDAQDALQNTMVKVLRALPGEERRIELKPWLYRIAHNESIELLRRRRETGQLDAELAAPGPGLAEEAASRERLRRLISDLDELPERQRGTLVMRELAGLDFAEIGAALGTSPAVARQTLYEARLSLRQMDEGREMSCETVTKALSDGDGRVTRRRDLRAHLRSCAGCRSFREEIEGRERDLAALSPLPALAAAGLLQGLLGGHGAGGGGLAGALGGGAAKSLGASAALKGAATVAVVAAIGVGAADRGGLIHVGLPGDGGSQATQVRQPAPVLRRGSRPRRARRRSVPRRGPRQGPEVPATSAPPRPGRRPIPRAGRTPQPTRLPPPQATPSPTPTARDTKSSSPAPPRTDSRRRQATKPPTTDPPGPKVTPHTRPSHPIRPTRRIPAPKRDPRRPLPALPSLKPIPRGLVQSTGSEEPPSAQEHGKKP